MIGWPDATNTGVPAGTALTVYNGDLVINTAGAVISGLDIHGTVTINAPNVTLMNCKVTDNSFFIINVSSSATGVIIQDCTVDGIGTGNDGSIGINGSGTFLRNNIFHVENGFGVGSNAVIQDNYIHNLLASGAPHYDGVQIDGGVSNVLVSHNTIIVDHNQTGAVMIDNWAGPISNITVDNNLLVGGSYTIYCDSRFNSTPVTGITVTNNHTGSGAFGTTFFTTTVTYTGNVSDGAALVQTLNQTGPGITAFSTDSGVVGDGITNDNTLTLSGSAEANSAVKVYDGATQIGTTTANASGAWTYTTAPLADGNHSFAITTTVGGMTSAPTAARSITIDTVAPSVPTISSFSNDTGTVGDGITADSTLTLTGTAVANSTVKVYDGATLLGSATANGSGAWSYTTGELPNGAHSLTATASDAAGNTSAASGALNVTVNAPPSLLSNGSFETGDFTGWTLSGNVGDSAWGPQALITSSGQSGQFAAEFGSVGTDGILSRSISTTAGQHYTLSFWLANASGSGPNDFTVNWNGQTLLALVNASAQGYTQYTFDVVGTGGAVPLEFRFQHDPAHWDIDSISLTPTGAAVPAGATISSYSTDSGVVGDGITNDNTLTFTGTAPANSTVSLYDGATLLGTVTANSSGAWSYTTAALSNATHSFTVTSTLSGTTSAASAVLTVTVDTAAPSAPTIMSYSNDSGTPGDSITNDNTLTLSGTAAAGSTVNVYDGATLLGTVTANGSGGWSYTTGALSNATHSFTATATDAAGNVSAASAALSVTVDSVTPSAPAITLYSNDTGTVGDGITSDNTLTLSGTAAAGSTVNVYDGANLLGTVTANGSGAWSYTTGALSNATHSFTATAADAAGNISAASASLSVTVDAAAPNAPTITSFDNDTGTVGDGMTNDDTLTLHGTAAANSTVIVYDGVTMLGSATADGSGAWSYTTATLSNAAHSFTATATDTAGNTSTASVPLDVTVDTVAPTAPTIDALLPDSGDTSTFTTAARTLSTVALSTTDATTSPTGFILSGKAAADCIVTVYDEGVLLGTTIATGTGSWSYSTGPLSTVTHSFTATATDAAGNTSAESVAVTVAIDPTTADLAATALTLNGATVSYQISNLGSVAAAASMAGLYLSTDANVTTADILLTTASIASLGSGAVDPRSVSLSTLSFPSGLVAGTYYLGVIADHNGQIAESNETNNASSAVAIILGNGNGNTLTGTSGNDALLGFGGNDTLSGGDGNDWLSGRSGRDMLIGGMGADVLDGGADTDTASYAASSSGVNVSLATGQGSGGDAAGDTLFNIENLTGSASNDTLEGDAGSNRLTGGTGVDTVSYEHAGAGVTVSLADTSSQRTGGSGSDTLSGFENLTGSAFNDVLTGSSGNNTLMGLAGNDVLNGGDGADLLIGGLGADKFKFTSASDSDPANLDVIMDFAHGIDVIDLSSIDAVVGQRGNQAFGFGGQNASVVANRVTWYESGGNTIVQADVSGNSTADFVLVLTGTNLHLTASDFLL